MPKQPEKKPKPRPVGRPKMARGEAKGKIVALRFSPEEHKKLGAAAIANGQTVSELIREAVNALMPPVIGG